jgi:hypothetical protein
MNCSVYSVKSTQHYRPPVRVGGCFLVLALGRCCNLRQAQPPQHSQNTPCTAHRFPVRLQCYSSTSMPLASCAAQVVGPTSCFSSCCFLLFPAVLQCPHSSNTSHTSQQEACDRQMQQSRDPETKNMLSSRHTTPAAAAWHPG